MIGINVRENLMADVFNSKVIDPLMKRIDALLQSQHREQMRLDEERIKLLGEIRDELRKQNGTGRMLN